MSEVVKTDYSQIMIFQKMFEMLSYKVRTYQLAQIVYIDILKVILAIAFSAKFLVDFLLFTKIQKQFFKRLYQRQSATARLRFRPVLLDEDSLAVNRRFRDNMIYGNCFPFEINRFPL